VKVGFANGCFDLFHQGHRHFLTQCRLHCGYLIVAVNSDESIRDRLKKGPDRPHDPLWTRMMYVRAFAEAVIPFDGYEEGLLVHIKPAVFFRGYDHGSHHTPDRGHYTQGSAQVAKGIGCDIVHIGHLEGFSTTLAAAGGERNAPKRDAQHRPPGQS